MRTRNTFIVSVITIALIIITFLVYGTVPQRAQSQLKQMAPPPPIPIFRLNQKIINTEKEVRSALNNHTFMRDVVLQTIGPSGEVTGEYIRNSQFLFDDRGRRIERVLFHPASTIREMRITKEDIQDLAGSQLLGIDIAEINKYRFSYAGIETIDSRQLFAIDITPAIEPDPQRMKERFFVGRVWVDPNTFQIIKIKGIVEPQGKQRFPIFEIWRETIKNSLAFPSRTEADDVLHFQGRDVHYRIRVSYYDYQLFGSKVGITDMNELYLDTNKAPSKTKKSPKVNLVPPTQPSRAKIEPQNQTEVCTTNQNAPPVGPYHWPADSEVKVYFTRNMFTSEQSVALLEAMKAWSEVSQDNGSGVKFIYTGETDNRMSCYSCLTISRHEVYKQDKDHYAFFYPMKQVGRDLLVSAWIDLDSGIKDLKALKSFTAHELGHGLGLWDCPSCKKKKSLMSSFPGLNKSNGLVAPSSCDLATVKSIYQKERQIGASNTVRNNSRVAAMSITSTNTKTANIPAPCQVGQQAPAIGFWTWAANTRVKVYIVLTDFKSEELPYILKVLENWNSASEVTGSGVKFEYQGSANEQFSCENCLTIMRGPVFDKTGRHVTELRAFSVRHDQIISYTAIVIDPKLTNLKALANAVAHELGHSLGLLDCYTCQKKSTLMNQFKAMNVPNDMAKPTSCDIAQVREAYKELKVRVRPSPPNRNLIDEGEEPEDDDTPIVIKKP